MPVGQLEKNKENPKCEQKKPANFAASAESIKEDLKIEQSELAKYNGLLQKEGYDAKLVPPSEATHITQRKTIILKKTV